MELPDTVTMNDFCFDYFTLTHQYVDMGYHMYTHVHACTNGTYVMVMSSQSLQGSFCSSNL